jgi:hypothetical protein
LPGDETIATANRARVLHASQVLDSIGGSYR